MKITGFILIFMLLGSAIAMGQSNQNREIYPDQAEHVEHNDAVISFSGDFVSAFLPSIQFFASGELGADNNNSAQINIIGSSNVSSISQFGVGHMALMNILGNFNNVSLDQRGNSNSSLINIEGDNNFVDYEQRGRNNFLGLDLQGSNFEQSYRQTGNNHSIQMNGNGLPITVHQDGGAGMSVIITNN